jgi:D-tagatose-1,6-bisphosphate aldolase subunit GatZ/KbaZ
MNTLEYFKELIEARKKGEPRGICSVCSAHPRVIAAAMAQAQADALPLLVESTVNQVNQFGGYAGMTPADFRSFVVRLAQRSGFPEERIIFGGDHLGPYPWRAQPADQAMTQACELVATCVAAGYSKIHLDASMPLGGDSTDSSGALDPDLIARREAQMAAAAENAFRQGSVSNGPGVSPPVYVIGTDVPPPGGIRADEEMVPLTSVDTFEQTIASCEKEFGAAGLHEPWERIVAVVVQPGMEFSNHEVYEYDHGKAEQLIAAAGTYENLLLEGHSTDYQRPELLRQLVADGVAILKVGPALTFALRECLFALEAIENELFGWSYKARLSQLGKFLDKAMRDNPDHWRKYYRSTNEELCLDLKFSLLDRSRYYWHVPMVEEAVTILLQNLQRVEIPHTLVSQYLPRHYLEIRRGSLSADPEALIQASIRMVLDDYSEAIR